MFCLCVEFKDDAVKHRVKCCFTILLHAGGNPLSDTNRPLATYTSLTDQHLAEYFSNPRVLKHLKRMGMVCDITLSCVNNRLCMMCNTVQQIDRYGKIMDEESIRLKHLREEHKVQQREMLAESIVQQAIELEVMEIFILLYIGSKFVCP